MALGHNRIFADLKKATGSLMLPGNGILAQLLTCTKKMCTFSCCQPGYYFIIILIAIIFIT